MEIYARPELGNAPTWVTEDTPIPSSKRTAIQTLKKYNNPKLARADFIELLNDLKSRVFLFNSQTSDYIHLYEEMLPFREEYLQIVKASFVIDDANVLIGDFLQDLYSGINSSMMVQLEIKKVFLHEIFIYTIAIMFKAKDYESLSYFLNRSYFGKKYDKNSQQTGFAIFYHNSQPLSQAKSKKDEKNYHSGTAQQWIDSIASDYCNKKEFAFADVLLCNYAFFGASYNYDWPWFPVSYIYDGEYDTILQDIASQMKSKEIAQRWSKVFGFDDFEQFQAKMRSVLEKMNSQREQRLRYNMSFSHVQLLSDFIKPDEIGIIK